MRDKTGILNADFRSVTKEEWEFLRESGVCNGYGPSNSPFLHWMLDRIAPKFPVIVADEHDRLYARGGTETDRKEADDGFVRALLFASYRLPKYQCAKYALLSLAYYVSVRAFGRWHFKYSR